MTTHQRSEDPPDPADILRDGVPGTIAEWKVLADGLLSDPCCAFHRNAEISMRYAWVHRLLPTCFKWAAMAAIASHHVRLALFPLRLDTDRSGFVDIPSYLMRRRGLLPMDVDTIRQTNNAIFDDIFWAHLAYVSADDGIGCLRGLLRDDVDHRPILEGFETIERGRRLLETTDGSPGARRGEEMVWAGNVLLLEHEQLALVQPHFDQLSCAFARLISIGSATSFEVRGRREIAYLSTFYGWSLTRGIPYAVRARTWPRITRYDDRWQWLVASVVPTFMRLDADTLLVRASLDRVIHDGRAHLAMPCIHPAVPPVRRKRR
jgi:hypothetical protein